MGRSSVVPGAIPHDHAGKRADDPCEEGRMGSARAPSPAALHGVVLVPSVLPVCDDDRGVPHGSGWLKHGPGQGAQQKRG